MQLFSYSGGQTWWIFKSEELSPSEDGQEGPLRFLQSHGKVVELLLHQETCSLLRKIHSHHGAGGEEEEEEKNMKKGPVYKPKPEISELPPGSPVGPVSCAKGIVDVNVSQFGQRRPEGVDLLLGGLRLQDTNRQRTNWAKKRRRSLM